MWYFLNYDIQAKCNYQIIYKSAHVCTSVMRCVTHGARICTLVMCSVAIAAHTYVLRYCVVSPFMYNKDKIIAKKSTALKNQFPIQKHVFVKP